ncbi:fic/DOC family protein [Ophiocordyceps sinensis CO18]|uniref:Fic/DOC family protein n=1 Tax=Ophiocordyceps sinensis (strain Co18 / CGMCC 3.14243) TaxID=911162 RepID=T5ALY3_OPHSC|nr:fic/DOC family protein [Ophiocordyceps sinensis CO18]
MVSPKKLKPSSLANALDGLELSGSSRLNTRSIHQTGSTFTPGSMRAQPKRIALDGPSGSSRLNLPRSIRQMMGSTFMPGGSMRAQSKRIETTFTIAMDDSYDYNILGEIDPNDLYEEMTRHTREVCKLLQILSSSQESHVETHLADVLVRLVFSSNIIENAGAGWDVTFKLCQAIFRGEEMPNEIDERDSEYAAIKQDLLRKGLAAGTEFVLRSRREIIQHAKAASYIINELYLGGKDVSEDIILETHRILTHKVDTEQGISWTEYSGVYRHDSVCAGLTSFVDSGLVRSTMRQMMASMNRDLEKAAEAQEIDPVAFSVKYCHTLVNIHPFMDGNGRACRLVLNAILLKYGGIMVSFGEEGGDREQYLNIAVRASQRESSQRDDFDDDDPLAPKHYRELASYTLGHVTASMRRLVQALNIKN